MFDEEPSHGASVSGGQEDTAGEVNGPLRPPTESQGEAPGAAEGMGTLFGADEEFHKHWAEWKGLPEYEAEDLSGRYQLVVSFRNLEDRAEFARLVGQPNITVWTPSIWYPKAEIDEVADLRWRSTQAMKPKVAGTTAQKRAKARGRRPAPEGGLDL